MKTEPKGINIQDVVKKVQKGQMNTNASETTPSPKTSKITVAAKTSTDDVHSLEEGIEVYPYQRPWHGCQNHEGCPKET